MKLKNRRPDRGRKLTASFALAMATVLVSAVLADEPYQFIITPGYDPAVYSTNTCSIVSSTATSLTTGTLSLPAAEPSSLEARFRTWLESLGTALKSTKFRHFKINFH